MSATKNSVYLVNKKLYSSARQEPVEEHSQSSKGLKQAIIPEEEEEDSKEQSR
jgi:hypothetical protein